MLNLTITDPTIIIEGTDKNNICLAFSVNNQSKFRIYIDRETHKSKAIYHDSDNFRTKCLFCKKKKGMYRDCDRLTKKSKEIIQNIYRHPNVRLRLLFM